MHPPRYKLTSVAVYHFNSAVFAGEGSRDGAGLPEATAGEADRSIAGQVVVSSTAEAVGGRTAGLAVLDRASHFAGFCPGERLKCQGIP